MPNEGKLNAELSRAAEAKRIKDSPIYAEAWELIENKYMEEWKSSPARDKEAREFLWIALRVVGMVKGHFEGVVDTGKMASVSLDKLRK